MDRLLGVFMTDSVNRYGTRFTPQALVFALWEEHAAGLPLLMSHDFLRAIGWTYPRAVYFEPGMTCLTNVAALAETAEDSEELGRALQSHMVKMARLYKEDIKQLQNLLAPYVQGNEKILPVKEGLAIVEEGLCQRVFPHLFEFSDDDGLIALSDLTPIGPGVYKLGELVVFAHQFFRRSLSRLNTLNMPFLSRLQEVKLSSASLRIAIDRDMVGLASSYKAYQELEYWWGPKFNDDLARIPRGVTYHKASQVECMFHAVSGTEFWWQSRDKQHIFEVEELRDIPAHFSDEIKYGCRYAHTIVDESTGQAFHFDGAIRAYSEEEMINRLDLDIARAGRHTEYTKLWRIDGEIPIELWKSLLSDYFRDNRLVGEYLGAQSEEPDIPSPPEAEERDPVARYVPYSMQAGQGIRVALSFHENESTFSSERTAVSLDALSYRETRSSYLEAWVVELAKAIARVGGSLARSPDALLVSFKDSYTNLPLISHNPEGVPHSLETTLAGIRLLVDAFNRRHKDLVLSYSVGFPVDGKEARISVLGHVSDLAHWLSNPLCLPPTDRRKLATWSDRVADFLRNTYPVANNKPSLFEILMPSGILLLNRQQLEERFSFQYERTEQGIRFGICVPEREEKLKIALENGDISPAMAYIKIASTCTRCHQEYRNCSCSKMLDGDVAEEITEANLLPAFWTDRAVLP